MHSFEVVISGTNNRAGVVGPNQEQPPQLGTPGEGRGARALVKWRLWRLRSPLGPYTVVLPWPDAPVSKNPGYVCGVAQHHTGQHLPALHEILQSVIHYNQFSEPGWASRSPLRDFDRGHIKLPYKIRYFEVGAAN